MTIREVVRRLRLLVGRARAERELEEEMRLHVALREERLRGDGLASDVARAAARRRFGNHARIREESVDAWGWRWLDQLRQDARFGARDLWHHRGFAATAILTLALATGATTAIFSVVNGVIVRPLPFDDPDRLVTVSGRVWREQRGDAPDPLTGPVGAREQEAFSTSRSFDGFAAYFVSTALLETSSGVERLTGASVERGLFALLGVSPLAGRTFQPDDPREVAIISEALWARRFGRDPAAIGRAATFDGRPHTIVGVMADDFQFPYRSGSLMPGALRESRTDVWLPIERRGRMSLVGRLRRGVSIDTGRAELSVMAAQIEEQDRVKFPNSQFRVGVRLEPLRDAVVAPVRRSLWMLFAAVALVLAAACANVANLLLARMSTRVGEVVTRAALGAGPLRLARQFLVESLILSLAGGVLGLAIARWGTALLMTRAAARIPRAHEVSLDWQAFMFLLLACVATAVLFGLAPAITAARMDVRGIAGEAGARATSGRTYKTVRDGLVILEVALAFVLATGSALVVREIMRLQNIETGIVADRVLTMHVTPRMTAAEYYAIEARVSQVPGVRAAGFTQMLPLQNWGWDADFTVKGAARDGVTRRAELRYVTPGYFEALGIPLVRGRALGPGDTEAAPKVVVVNQALARRYFPGRDPIGVELDRGTIVGLVGDVRQVALDRPADPELYYPAAQNLTMAPDLGLTLVVSTSGEPQALTGAVRAAVLEVKPAVAIFQVKTMTQVLSDSLWRLHLYRWLIGLFAALALVLAGIGLYGVIAYSTAARTREFAIRIALGSEPGAVRRLVVVRGLGLAGVGLALGVAAALSAWKLTASRDVLAIAGGPDAATLGLTGAVVLAIALVACAVPAARAGSVNPAVALKPGA